MDRLAPPTSILDGNGQVPVVMVQDLWKQFGDTAALAGVSLEVRAGQIQVIMGPSGCGKSVLLKHLVGLLRPSRGEVMVFGEPAHPLPEDALDAPRIGEEGRARAAAAVGAVGRDAQALGQRAGARPGSPAHPV